MPYKDPQKALDYSREWKRRNADKVRPRAKRYRLANKEKAQEYAKQRSAANPGRAIENTNRWRAENPEKVRHLLAKRRAAQLQAVPRWADKVKILGVYRKAAELGHDVDHIVPLVSLKVCGLHVQDNLQILPSDENRRKGNRWWPDMFEDAPFV